ncbi:hypothetical protein [Natrinema gari]|nr:hypothetical protein [Natrinema gari]
MLAVGVYATFERRGVTDLLWVAPLYPIGLHYLNNSFAVLSSVVLATASEATQLLASDLFGVLILLLGVALLAIVIVRHDIAESLHREPFLFLRGIL